MTSRTKQILKLTLRMLVTTALLAWVFSQVDFGQFVGTVKSARWQYLLGVWAYTAVFFWIESLVMQIILRKQGCEVKLNTVFGASALTSLYGMVLPGILSTGVKWYVLQRDTGKGTNVLSGMLYNQFVLLLIMAAVGLSAVIITNPATVLLTDTRNAWLLPVVCAVLLAGVIGLWLLMLSPRAGGPIIKSLGVLLRLLPQKVRHKGTDVLGQLASFQTAGIRFHLKVAALTLLASLVACIFQYDAAAKAANISVPAGVSCWLCAAIIGLGRIPISVSNLGVREVTLVGVLAFYGVEKSAALLMSVMLFSSAVFMALLGAGYQFWWAIRAKK
jgi:uncharacterized membrane protein YbhN (UPF0104 family)